MIIIHTSFIPNPITIGSTRELNEATIILALKAIPAKTAKMTQRYYVVMYSISSLSFDSHSLMSWSNENSIGVFEFSVSLIEV